MSITKAILFYSKYNKKSLIIKEAIDEFSIDIETISVDSSIIRKKLKEDDEYNIDEVPTVLLLYSTGTFKIYTRKPLDVWFEQLMTNIQKITMEANKPKEPIKQQQEAYTSLIDETQMENQHDDDYDNTGVGEASPLQQAINKDHIRGVASDIKREVPVQQTRKEVKTETLSAGELAKQMAEQREKIEENIEENRPFM